VHLTLLEPDFSRSIVADRGERVAMADIEPEAAAPNDASSARDQRALFTNPDQRTVQGALLGQEHLARTRC